MKEPLSIRFSIESALENVRLAGAALGAVCSHLEPDEEKAYLLQAGVIEALNNVIKHSYRMDGGHRVEIVLSAYRDRLVFQVSDTGAGMDDFKGAHRGFDFSGLRDIPENGMGLYIIERVMDKVAYSRTGRKNVLTMTKYLPRK
jgi:anti-sigma regulatory factor (Ser/Thr protein kinase)